jgi:hypothetical protein
MALVMLRLTEVERETSVWLSRDQIAVVGQDGDGNTMVILTSGRELMVLEGVEAIVDMVHGGRG